MLSLRAEGFLMASKFATFLEQSGIDARRVVMASAQIERLKLADRHVLAAKASKKAKGKDAGAGEASPEKELPSGRPVTTVLVNRALAGKPLRSKAKTRIVRAVNRVLEQKKKDPADLRALF